MKKFLIVGAAWVGDVVMSQTLFRVLKEQDPSCVIDVLAPAFIIPLLERMPEVNKTWVMSVGHGKFDLKTRWHLGRTLRKEKYDQAMVLPNSWKSALIPFFAGIPKRTGWLGEARFFLLNDWRKLDVQKYPLMIERFMALSSLRGRSPWQPRGVAFIYKIFFILKRFLIASRSTPLDCHVAQNAPRNDEHLPKLTASINTQFLQKKFSLEHKKILALCPGAQFGSSKCWPAEYFAVVANQKLKEGWVVLLMGGKDDQIISATIQAATQNGCLDLAGKTNLGEAIDLLSLATAVVSNDSGLMHIAAALDRPLVAMYGSTSPGFTPPLNKEAVVLMVENLACRPCFQRECPLRHHQCMRDLSPVLVLNALEKISE